MPEVPFQAYPRTSRIHVLHAFITTLGRPEMGLQARK